MVSFNEADFKNTYHQLGEQYSSSQAPTPVASPELIRINAQLAKFLGLNPEQLHTAESAALLAGNQIPIHSTPIAAVYAGHQFGHWNPQLGDGRAVLLGELLGADNKLYDVQLKGGGPTPYSRMGDGRSPLGPVLREYVVSEAMAALDIPTTRSLAAVSTGERVVRDSLLPGAVLTRVAQSHIRVGTFQFFSARQDLNAVRTLANYVIERHYSTFVAREFASDPYTGLLYAVINAQARLIAQWMSIGFIHGVMNTDNMLLSGETVDYGPCAFMDRYNPGQVYSSIDQQGRYAYNNQPSIAGWNLSWLAQALIPLMADTETAAIEKAQAALNHYSDAYSDHYDTFFARKLGFDSADENTVQLVKAFLNLLHGNRSDFTLSFRALLGQVDSARAENIDTLPAAFDEWIQSWQSALTAQGIAPQQASHTIARNNPLFIPRNHWLQLAIDRATEKADFGLFNRLVETLANPFNMQADHLELAQPPAKGEEVFRTFCGT